MPTGRVALTLQLTPSGHLHAIETDTAPPIESDLAQRLLRQLETGSGHGLLELGTKEVGTTLPAVLSYWRDFAAKYVATVCATPALQGRPESAVVPAPDKPAIESMVAGAPPMEGLEYLTPAVAERLWDDLDQAFRDELSASNLPLEKFLHERSRAWSLIGRVHFNLAEYRLDPETPFAFLATYTKELSPRGKAQHAPLGRALVEFSGETNRARLLSLLTPVQRAAETCAWVKDLVDTGDLYHPLRWTAAETYRFLQDVPQLEAAGVIVRLPAGWKTGRPSRARAGATIGTKPPAGIGVEALLDFQMNVTLDGEPLAPSEISALLSGTAGLRFLRGRWVEVNPETLQRMIERLGRIERTAAERGVTFSEAMRLVSGAGIDADERIDPEDREWTTVSAGEWLTQILAGLRGPEGLAALGPAPAFHGTLRPYQEVGVRWMHLLTALGLGACLADDMGLGKTIQVLSLIAAKAVAGPGPALVIAPASLVANWAAEIDRFAPDLRTLIAHPSMTDRAQLSTLDSDDLDRLDIVVTSYTSLARYPALTARRWTLLVIDEAQAIKNPAARQTRSVRGIAAQAKIALTGTPVENRLTDLWSIFDVINPGLLGSHALFAKWTKRLGAPPQPNFAPLRDLVRPYILRRMKTDPQVIRDLPPKTEVPAFCTLSPVQAALYQDAVEELGRKLASKDGIERKGLVLSYLMRFKQIVNHPSHFLGDDRWREADSGKFRRLREIAETIAARQEKVLVFTQFREMTGPLASFLDTVFGRSGVVLHGGTPVGRRRAIVAQFQEDEETPYFVLSLKAGGTGLNLTAASHVVHFDRWWNPAVEQQASDRAFRIGQTRPVLVHKFICRGTVEEKIEALLASKDRLARDLLAQDEELRLTELDDQALLALVSLDIRKAAGDAA